MECQYTKWCLLMFLTFHLDSTVTSAAEIQQALEFGARLRTLSSSNKYGANGLTATSNWTINVPQHAKLSFAPKSSSTELQPTKNNSNTSNKNYPYPYRHPRKESVKKAKYEPRSPSEQVNISNSYYTLHSKNLTRKPENGIPYRNNRAKVEQPTAAEKKNLVGSPNLQFNRIEPFWPFSNISSMHLLNGFKSPDVPNTGFPYNSLPERFKDTTFFFSHVGPNSFEYRAQFHHGQNEFEQPKFFKPFVNEYPDFQKITFPPFPSFPESPDFFQNKPQLPDFPNLNHVPFPTVSPPIKRILHPTIENPGQTGIPDKTDFGKPFKHYDVVLGEISTKYPKIFRFNQERINIEDFEKQKKLQVKINGLNHNFLNEPENVQRDHLLILHGGIFTVKEPPLYHRKVIRKRRQRFRELNRISKN